MSIQLQDVIAVYSEKFWMIYPSYAREANEFVAMRKLSLWRSKNKNGNSLQNGPKRVLINNGCSVKREIYPNVSCI